MPRSSNAEDPSQLETQVQDMGDDGDIEDNDMDEQTDEPVMDM